MLSVLDTTMLGEQQLRQECVFGSLVTVVWRRQSCWKCIKTAEHACSAGLLLSSEWRFHVFLHADTVAQLIPDPDSPLHERVQQYRQLLDSLPMDAYTHGCILHPELTTDSMIPKYATAEIRSKWRLLTVMNVHNPACSMEGEAAFWMAGLRLDCWYKLYTVKRGSL